MLPEWAGRKATTGMSRPVVPADTAPLPAGGGAETDEHGLVEDPAAPIEDTASPVEDTASPPHAVEDTASPVDDTASPVEGQAVDRADVEAESATAIDDAGHEELVASAGRGEARGSSRAAVTAEMPRRRRLGALLVLAALLALAAGIGAGYAYLMFAS